MTAVKMEEKNKKTPRSYLSIEDILDKTQKPDPTENPNHHSHPLHFSPNQQSPVPKEALTADENTLSLFQKQGTVAASVSSFFAPVEFDSPQSKLDTPSASFGAKKAFFPWNPLEASDGNSQAIISMQRKSKREMNSRRQRTSFTAEQTIKLELEFQINEYITRSRRFELADVLGLSENQIKIWYQNRRAKDKRIEKAHLESHLRRQLSHLSALNVAMLSSATTGSLYPGTTGPSDGLAIPGKEAADALMAVEKYISERAAFAHQSHAPKTTATTVCSTATGLFNPHLFAQSAGMENSFSLF